FYAFNNFVLPQLLKAAGAGDLLTGLLSSTRSIEGAIIQPTVGALSDRTRTRLGRRRPYIALGIPLSAAFFLFAATQHDVLGLTVGGLREPAIVDRTEERVGLRRYAAELIEHRQAMRYLGAIFVFMVGFSAVLPYLTLFITVDIGETEQIALALAAGTLLVT